MASAAAARAPGSANTARIAAKQRRQKILVVVLAVVLVALLAYEVPHLLKRRNSSSSAAPAAPAASSATPHRRTRQSGSAGRGTAPTRSPSSRCRTATPAPRPPAGPTPSRLRRRRRPSSAATCAGRAPEADRDRPSGRSPGREARLDRHPRLDPDEERARRGSALRAQRARQRRRALGPQLVESPTAARRLLGRLLRPVPDAGGGLPTRRRHPRGRLPDRLHPRADRVPVRRLKTWLRAEDGMTLIELLIAMVVMSIGIAALVAGFSSGILSVNRARLAVDGRLARRQADGALPPGGVHLAADRRCRARRRRPARTGAPTGCRSTISWTCVVGPRITPTAARRRLARARPRAVRSSS